ncbi:MAG: hypothetical protein KJ950_13920 [Proteobacteria bacterium]|nr:hypothetical protein [Pseudomonadota bacterium]MBU1686107.1 hypothetical protein [Pseudomonadota bacterium]
MDERIQKRIVGSLIRLLRPLVAILLRNGVTYQAFTYLARWVYVDVAGDLGLPGKQQTTSRISVLTGLNRKEVQRLRQLDLDKDLVTSRTYNRAARVVSGWLRDKDFHDSSGNPANLLVDGDQGSFSALVRKHSGDMPVRAILDELLAAKVVARDEEGRIRLETRAYVPRHSDVEKISILGIDGGDLLGTIDHNLLPGQERFFFQRKVAYDNVPEEAIAAFREVSAGEGQDLLEKLDRWLAEHDRDGNPVLQGTGRKRVGMGIYYFEEDVSGDETPIQ